MQFFDALFGGAHTVCAFKMEGFGDHPNRQHAMIATGFGQNWCGTGSGATAHTRGDEDHIGPGQMFHRIGHGFFGGFAAHFWAGPSAQTLR